MIQIVLIISYQVVLESNNRFFFLVSLAERWPVALKFITGKAVTVMVSSLSSVWDIKQLIHDQEGFHPYSLSYIIFNGQALNDFQRLERYGISRGSELSVVLRLRGGGNNESPTKGRK